MNIRVVAVLWMLRNNPKRKENYPWPTFILEEQEHFIRWSYVNAVDYTNLMGEVRIAIVLHNKYEDKRIVESGVWHTESLVTWPVEKLDKLLQELEPGFDVEVWQFQQELLHDE